MKGGEEEREEGGVGGVSSSTHYSTAVASEPTTTHASFISGRLATPCGVLRPSLSAEPELSNEDLKKKKKWNILSITPSEFVPALLVRGQSFGRMITGPLLSTNRALCSCLRWDTRALQRLRPPYNPTGSGPKGKSSHLWTYRSTLIFSWWVFLWPTVLLVRLSSFSEFARYR